MLHYRKSPAEVKKAYAFAAVAKMENIPFFYFSYSAVDFNRKLINGWIFEDGKWVLREMRFPEVIINISSPKTRKQLIIQKELKASTIFTSYPVGNKMKVYKKIKRGQQFANYLIPSTQLINGESVWSLLNKYPKVVIKPYSGNQGKNVFFLKKERME